MSATEKELRASYEKGFREAVFLAQKCAEDERNAAQKELTHADQTKNFNPLTVAATKVRLNTAKKLGTMIRKLKP